MTPKASGILFTPMRISHPLYLKCWAGPCDGQVVQVTPMGHDLSEPDGALVWHIEPYTKTVLPDGGFYEVQHCWDQAHGNRGLILK